MPLVSACRTGTVRLYRWVHSPLPAPPDFLPASTLTCLPPACHGCLVGTCGACILGWVWRNTVLPPCLPCHTAPTPHRRHWSAMEFHRFTCIYRFDHLPHLQEVPPAWGLLNRVDFTVPPAWMHHWVYHVCHSGISAVTAPFTADLPDTCRVLPEQGLEWDYTVWVAILPACLGGGSAPHVFVFSCHHCHSFHHSLTAWDFLGCHRCHSPI